jgi:hypothetical protein
MRFVRVQFNVREQEYRPADRLSYQGDGFTYLISDLAPDDFLPVTKPEPEPEPELVEAAKGR